MNVSHIKCGLFGLFVTALLFGCHSYNIKPNISSEDRFEVAQRMFHNKDYEEAKTQFKIVTLNSPGAPFVDEAQFRLAECHFALKEFILAGDEYNRLIRLYPRSEFVDDAQFKIALSDFKLSPKPPLDQKYTISAVANFQRFIEDFPNSELVPEAERLLKICRTKLAEKDFNTGGLYRKLDDCYAALVYYDSVLDHYYDTKFAHPSLFWKGECLYNLNRKDEALAAFNELLIKFPTSSFKSKARERLKEIDSGKVRVTDGKASVNNQN
jgi:outer membrane protein assembly factor BamD